jgi:hypothetical protein
VQRKSIFCKKYFEFCCSTSYTFIGRRRHLARSKQIGTPVHNYYYYYYLLLLLLEYVYPTEQVQLRDRRIAREKKYIQITLPKDVKRMLMYVIIFAHGI